MAPRKHHYQKTGKYSLVTCTYGLDITQMFPFLVLVGCASAALRNGSEYYQCLLQKCAWDKGGAPLKASGTKFCTSVFKNVVVVLVEM